MPISHGLTSARNRPERTAGSSCANFLISSSPSPAAGLEEPLTDKEERILQLIAEGMSNKQIGAAVFLAEGTVKNYVSRIMEKLHARSRTELAVRAIGRRG